MTIINVALRSKLVMVSTHEDAQRVYLKIVFEDNRNYTAALSLDETRLLIAALEKHAECAAVGHDALRDGDYDAQTGVRKKVCRRCGDVS